MEEKCEKCTNRLNDHCVVFESKISKDTVIMCLEYDLMTLKETVKAYKSMEKGFGPGFLTVSITLEQGFYWKYLKKMVKPLRLVLEPGTKPHFEVFVESLGYSKIVLLEDYGKTWALTKEKLE